MRMVIFRSHDGTEWSTHAKMEVYPRWVDHDTDDAPMKLVYEFDTADPYYDDIDLIDEKISRMVSTAFQMGWLKVEHEEGE